MSLKSCTLLYILLLFSAEISYCQDIDSKVESLLKQMTLEEKIGQLNQLSADKEATGPVTTSKNKIEDIRTGRVGSMLNIKGAAETMAFQKIALQSRLKIPLLFGLDVIHGYRVTFPIPLAEAASWDLEIIERSARIAAKETAAAGVHWTFAPMVDICRDPRWGRIMEGAGEDTYLGSMIAGARVRGFQGKGLGNTDAVMACAKHFAGYGAAIGGRDYNSVDMSMRTLWETHLPPFKAALDAGAATFMNSFNDLNGIPATGSSYLQREVLKGKWKFDGFVVSDWGSIKEMVPHGYAKNTYEAAEMAMKAGSDMDMESRSYINHLSSLIADGKLSVELVDEAVRRVLKKKFELGLFDNPFKFSDLQREKQVLNHKSHVAAAREVAAKSVVLLKNQDKVLPLSGELKKIALIGPLVKSEKDMQGFWSIDWGKDDHLVSLYEGMKNQSGKTELLYSKGCEVTDTSKAGFAHAVSVAREADVVIMAVGERFDMSGEAKSRANIHLPGVQEELVKAIHATGKKVIVLVMAGRPLIFNWTADHVPAIVYTWWLGSQAGNAIADVLYGKYNPSAKLPVTFPRHEGQIPIYYNYLNTGRPPLKDNDHHYKTGYIDTPNSPRYEFGYGLTYTSFVYSDVKLNKDTLQRSDSLKVSLKLTNTGDREGEEVVQLYIRDLTAQPLRPVKELKDFKKIYLNNGESKTITFTIDEEKLSFYNEKLDKIAQAGDFQLMIGNSSKNIIYQKNFHLK